MNLAGGTPFATDNEFILDGKRYHLAADNRGQVALAIQRVSDQDVDAATPYSIPIHDFSRGSGFSFEGPDGTYDEADGWDLSTPGKAVTWPLLATGETLAGTDAKGWQFFLSGYLYVGRGRYVVKYEPDDTAGSEWPIIEIHDLGSGNVFGGRPALFKGKAYVPIRAGAFGTAQRFHQLTTVATHVVEEQTIVISGTPTGGTYTVAFDGKTSGNIAYNANQATVQAALRAIAGLELVTVVTTGSVPDYTHTVTMTGVAGAMGAASAPQMTSSAASLTGGAPAINHATTVAGTTDTWTQGPATYEATAFRAWRDRLARADSNTISLVSGDPMTGGDWGPEYSVGNSGEPITDLAVYGRMLIVAKTNGLYSFDEETTVTNETPDLEGIVDDSNMLGLEMAQGYLLVPHKTGLIRWRPGAWEYVGAEAEGGLEGAVSGGWGRVQGIAAAGRYTFLVTANPLDQTGTLLSLNPTGGRQTQALTPHMHQEEAAAYLEHVTVISRSTEPASPRTAGTLADDSAVGTITWTTPENADDSDDTYATAAVGTSHYLKATNYGFNIPTSATITGVRVSVERSATD